MYMYGSIHQNYCRSKFIIWHSIYVSYKYGDELKPHADYVSIRRSIFIVFHPIYHGHKISARLTAAFQLRQGCLLSTITCISLTNVFGYFPNLETYNHESEKKFGKGNHSYKLMMVMVIHPTPCVKPHPQNVTQLLTSNGCIQMKHLSHLKDSAKCCARVLILHNSHIS